MRHASLPEVLSVLSVQVLQNTQKKKFNAEVFKLLWKYARSDTKGHTRDSQDMGH